MWEEKIECIEYDGKFYKIQEMYRSPHTDIVWYATKKLDETKRSGIVSSSPELNNWDSKELKLSGTAKKITRKNWYKDSRVRMVYESEVYRE